MIRQKKRGRGELHNQGTEKKGKGVVCAFCKAVSDPVWGTMRRDKVLWICSRCYRKEKEA